MKFLRDSDDEKKGLAKFFYNQKLRWTHGFVPGWYDLKRGLKNLVRWFPHVWKHRDWDGQYTIDMLIASLTFQRERLSKYSHEIDETLLPKIVDIDLVLSLLKKVQDESNYTDHINEYYDKLYGEDEMYFEPFKKSQEDREALGEFDDKSDVLYTMRSSREDKLGEEAYEKYRTEWAVKMKAAEAERVVDRVKAFTIMATNIDGWWE